MNILSQIDTSEFYFNGHWSSEFDVYAYGKNKLEISMVVDDEDETRKIMGIDGEKLLDSNRSPRVFSIPLYIQDTDRIREISSWLGYKYESDFYFKDDNIKIACKHYGTVDLEPYIEGGTSEIKLIAYDPYYYEINQITHTFTSNFDSIKFYNLGTENSKPLIKVYGDDTITIGLNGETLQIENVDTYVEIDTLTYEVYKADANMYDNTTCDWQNFMVIPNWNSISVSNATKIEITPCSKWL